MAHITIGRIVDVVPLILFTFGEMQVLAGFHVTPY